MTGPVDEGRKSERLRDYLFALPALLLFAQGALTQIDLPGIYLDAINPDYIALRWLAPPKMAPVWLLPGNLLFGKFPILIQIYHGALPFYVGLPFYWLFGTGMFGIRVANLVFGLLVLTGFALAARRLKLDLRVAGLALAALALDPGFLYAFRTQFYITTLPLALTFASLAISPEGASRRRLVAAGALAGLSIYGYFVYAFLAPALAWRIWRLAGAGERQRALQAWVLGAALGVTPFALGLLLVLLTKGGPSGFLTFFAQYFHEIAITPAMTLPDRFGYGGFALVATTRALGPMAMMTNGLAGSAPELKSALLLGGPALAFALSLRRGAPWQAAQTTALGIAGLFILFVLFGGRAWLHHAAPALPLMYFGLAALSDTIARRGRVLFALAALPLVALIWVNGIDRQHAELALERTGGVGFYSDALTHFELDAARTPRPTEAFLPGSNLILPFAMLTGGEIRTYNEFTPELARRALCAGRDALLGVMAKEPPERLAAWIAATDWPAPETVVYRDRGGAPSVIGLRWRADAKPDKPCR